MGRRSRVKEPAGFCPSVRLEQRVPRRVTGDGREMEAGAGHGGGHCQGACIYAEVLSARKGAIRLALSRDRFGCIVKTSLERKSHTRLVRSSSHSVVQQ